MLRLSNAFCWCSFLLAATCAAQSPNFPDFFGNPRGFVFDGLVAGFITQTGKCPAPHSDRTMFQSVIDQKGTGFKKTFDCYTGALLTEMHRLDGVPDGIVLTPTLKGQFKNGGPDGIWTYRDARQTFKMDFTGGNGYWIVPASYLNPPLPYYTTIEEGAFVSGKRDGLWFLRSFSTGVVSLRGEYVNGQLSGAWRSSGTKQFDPFTEVTYSNGILDGPFIAEITYGPNQTFRVEGELHGDSDFDRFGFVLHQTGDHLRSGTISGVWRYYDTIGRLALENHLLNGTGHFVIPSTRFDGTKSFEGEVVNGKPSGTWIGYDDIGRPRRTYVVVNDTWQFGPIFPLPVPGLVTYQPVPQPQPQPHPGQPAQPGQPTDVGTVTAQHGFLVQFTAGTDNHSPATMFVKNGASGKSDSETVAVNESNLVCATTLERTAWSAGLSATLTGNLGSTVRIVEASTIDVVTVSGCGHNITTF